MSFFTAVRAFWKAWKEPAKGVKFLEEAPPKAIEKKKEEPDHLRLLGMLQRSGRLLDFLKEDLTPYSDEQVGAVVRKVQQDCAETLEELVTIRPLLDESEGSEVQIPKEYNPEEIRLVGSVKGEGPFHGKLLHKGWRAHKRALPKASDAATPEILAAAEVEVAS